MTPDGGVRARLPEPVRKTLDEFREAFGLDVHVWRAEARSSRVYLYPEEEAPPSPDSDPTTVTHTIAVRDGPPLVLEVHSPTDEVARTAADILHKTLERTLEFSQEIRFFTFELSERYEEINLLYSISETLGSILRLDEAAGLILAEVCDVMGARQGALWVFEPGLGLSRVAKVGDSGGSDGAVPSAITSWVFEEGRAFLSAGDSTLPTTHPPRPEATSTSVLSVPIRYTPPAGEPRTVGVIDLVGRRHGDRFTTSDQKLLSAIASQVGAAVENSRLIQESLEQERVTKEMELAHDLQMKLLPAVDHFDAARVAARVEPAEEVGGDFYYLLKLPGGRVGVMIGDVSSHGFPAALIMALSMSAAAIYAAEVGTPALALRHMDDALRDELETTEMYVTLFYGVLDPEAGELVYSNAGHPHAFAVRGDGAKERLTATDPPVGIAGPGSYEERHVPFDPESDLLLLFTDGLSDTLAVRARGSGEEIVLNRVAELRDEEPSEIVTALFEQAARAVPSIPSDDRTAIILKA